MVCFSPHPRPGSCYETATTRKFFHGRTETMRPCTLEAVEWCNAMLDPTSNVRVEMKCQQTNNTLHLWSQNIFCLDKCQEESDAISL